ncbi:MAG TPA: hypothetical protein VKN18_32490 [Blastocatellia bacterium]|nr:hypothetical protein [Blastocatellia bacterium]
MKFPEIIPPADLLKQVDGIESGLRQRQRLGIIGLLATLVQGIILVANNEWFQKLLARDWTDLFKTHWPSLLMLAGIVFFVFLAGWARFWLDESQAPFRYTYSIADFKPVLGEKADGPREDRISVQLSHDLAERLNERIKRLSLLDEETKPAQAKSSDEDSGTGSRRKSHIHIRGFYLIRTKPDGSWFVEVMPNFGARSL